MKIHEYQGKELLKNFGVTVPRGIPAFSVNEAVTAAVKLGGSTWVVKAQIHAGGRGKGGGVKLAHSIDEVRKISEELLGMQLITYQTSSNGQKVCRLLIEEGISIKQEYYIAILIDRNLQKICIMASNEGGMDIEQIGLESPEKIHKIFVDPVHGLENIEIEKLVVRIEIPDLLIDKAVIEIQNLYRTFWETDASLLEINPFVLTNDNRLISLDTKLNFDSNALFRHPSIFAYRDLNEEDPAEIKASNSDLSYIQLNGDIGCLVNGAGLAMATMDTIKLFNGEPANFLDVGGGATVQKVTDAFQIMLENKDIKAILVNIFGGIMRCDVIAEGLLTACKNLNLNVPLVVRMKGTNETLGKDMLSKSGLPIISADTMSEAASLVVTAARK